jgi:hypothetical protein
VQELIPLAPWFVTGIVGVGGILRWLHDLRSNAEYRAAQERIVAAKDAQIAQIQETVKAKDAHTAGFQERLKSKDDYIEHLKSQRAPDVLSVLDAQQQVRERVITALQTQLAEVQASHARSEQELEQEIESLRDQLALARATLSALERVDTAIRTEVRNQPLSVALAGVIAARGGISFSESIHVDRSPLPETDGSQTPP